MRRLSRILGTVLIVGGVGTLGWSVLVWQWQDPFTAVYAKYEQRKLTSQYQRLVREYEPARHLASRRGMRPIVHNTIPAGRDYQLIPESAAPPLADQKRLIGREARAYRQRLTGDDTEGRPFARLRVPRLGLSVVAVNGTGDGTLTRGPGRFRGSFLPGQDELIYIAGHRTTYGAPFAKIDGLRPGDAATLEVPYGTFEYRATRQVIVDDDDLSVLRSHHQEVLALQACHPRFFASQRYIVYFELVRVTPRTGPGYAVSGSRLTPA